MISDGSRIRGTIADACVAAGIGAPRDVTELAGGLNNRVYAVEGEHERAVAKVYFRLSPDARDRQESERSFVAAVRAAGVDDVPAILAVDAEAGVTLFQFIEGRRPKVAELAVRHVDAAADFVANIQRANGEHLVDAEDAAFSIEAHLAGVRRRLSVLGDVAALEASSPEFAEFVTAELLPHWERAEQGVLNACADSGVDPSTILPAAERCLSPSDFGFHNALERPDGSIVFLDFEYAGRDDPAKLLADFALQPEVPVPQRLMERFASRVCERLRLTPDDERRVDVLLSVHRVKWCCIMLNDFVPEGARRRRFAETSADTGRCGRQLQKARRALTAARAAV